MWVWLCDQHPTKALGVCSRHNLCFFFANHNSIRSSLVPCTSPTHSCMEQRKFWCSIWHDLSSLKQVLIKNELGILTFVVLFWEIWWYHNHMNTCRHRDAGILYYSGLAYTKTKNKFNNLYSWIILSWGKHKVSVCVSRKLIFKFKIRGQFWSPIKPSNIRQECSIGVLID